MNSTNLNTTDIAFLGNQTLFKSEPVKSAHPLTSYTLPFFAGRTPSAPIEATVLPKPKDETIEDVANALFDEAFDVEEGLDVDLSTLKNQLQGLQTGRLNLSFDAYAKVARAIDKRIKECREFRAGSEMERQSVLLSLYNYLLGVEDLCEDFTHEFLQECHAEWMESQKQIESYMQNPQRQNLDRAVHTMRKTEEACRKACDALEKLLPPPEAKTSWFSSLTSFAKEMGHAIRHPIQTLQYSIKEENASLQKRGEQVVKRIYENRHSSYTNLLSLSHLVAETLIKYQNLNTDHVDLTEHRQTLSKEKLQREALYKKNSEPEKETARWKIIASGLFLLLLQAGVAIKGYRDTVSEGIAMRKTKEAWDHERVNQAPEEVQREAAFLGTVLSDKRDVLKNMSDSRFQKLTSKYPQTREVLNRFRNASTPKLTREQFDRLRHDYILSKLPRQPSPFAHKSFSKFIQEIFNDSDAAVAPNQVTKSLSSFGDEQHVEGWNSVHLAAATGNVPQLKKIVENNGWSVLYSATDNNDLPLTLAAKYNQTEAFNFITSNINFDLYANKQGLKAIHYAASRGNAEMLRKMPTTLWSDNDKVMDLAVRSLNPQAAVALVDLGWDVNAVVGYTDQNVPYTPLQLAISLEDDQMVLALIEKGADVNKAVDPSILSFAADQNVSPLHLAAKSKNPKILQILLQKGANPNLRDKYGETPLFSAVRNHCVENVELLLKNRADANVVKWGSSTSYTPLHLALNNLPITKLLIAHGADVNAPYRMLNDYRSPLTWATAFSRMDIAAALIEAGADTENRSEKGVTPFTICSWYHIEDECKKVFGDKFLNDPAAEKLKNQMMFDRYWSIPTDEMPNPLLALELQKAIRSYVQEFPGKLNVTEADLLTTALQNSILYKNDAAKLHANFMAGAPIILHTYHTSIKPTHYIVVLYQDQKVTISESLSSHWPSHISIDTIDRTKVTESMIQETLNLAETNSEGFHQWLVSMEALTVASKSEGIFKTLGFEKALKAILSKNRLPDESNANKEADANHEMLLQYFELHTLEQYLKDFSSISPSTLKKIWEQIKITQWAPELQSKLKSIENIFRSNIDLNIWFES